MYNCRYRKSCVKYAMPDINMYETGSGNKLYMPAIVFHLPSTNSMARIKPAYVTDTETSPSRPRRAKCSSNEFGKYSAMPVCILVKCQTKIL